MWLAVAITILGCACPEPKHSEGTTPTPSAMPAEGAPTTGAPATTPPTGEVQPATPATPPATGAETTPPPAATPPATPAATPPAAPAAELPSKAGAPCDDKGCGGGFECKAYYGIAGPKGPQMKTCEISCSAKGAKCPDGTKCITIADGPGRVCR